MAVMYSTSPKKEYQRISRSATIRLNAEIEKVFPLFGPVREKEWAFGWEPEILFSNSSLIEEKMIFRTSGIDGYYTWAVTKYQPDNHTVEYTVHTSNRIWFITVSCVADASTTLATVTYTYTSLTVEGTRLNMQALNEMFRFELSDWEEAINYFLLSGRILQPQQHLTTLKQ